MEASAATRKLTAIKGIGRWTADVYLLFCGGHVKWFRPDEYHSTTEYADSARQPVPSTATAVPEPQWRKYWDVTYDAN